MGFFQARVLEWGAIAFSDPGSLDPIIRKLSNTINSQLYASMEKAMAPHSSTLAWKNPMDGGA